MALQDLLATLLAMGYTPQDLMQPSPAGQKGTNGLSFMRQEGQAGQAPSLLTRPQVVGPGSAIVPLSQPAQPGAAQGVTIPKEEYFKALKGLPDFLQDDFTRNFADLGLQVAKHGGKFPTHAIAGEAGPEVRLPTMATGGATGDPTPAPDMGEDQGQGVDKDWDSMSDEEKRRLLALLYHADIPQNQQPQVPTETEQQQAPTPGMLPARTVPAAPDQQTSPGAQVVQQGASPMDMAQAGMPDLTRPTMTSTPDQTPADQQTPMSTAVKPGDTPDAFVTVNGVRIPLLVARGILSDIDAGMTPARAEDEARVKGIASGDIAATKLNLQTVARLPMPEAGKTGVGAAGTIRWEANEDGTWTWYRKATSLAEADTHKAYGFNSRGEPSSSEPGWIKGATVKDLDDVRQVNALLVGGSNPAIESNPAFNQQRGTITDQRGNLNIEGLRREMELDPNLLQSVRSEVQYYDSPAGLIQRTREEAEADPAKKQALAKALIESGDLPPPPPLSLPGLDNSQTDTPDSQPLNVRTTFMEQRGDQWQFRPGVSYEPVTPGAIYPGIITLSDGRQYLTEDGQTATLLPADGQGQPEGATAAQPVPTPDQSGAPAEGTPEQSTGQEAPQTGERSFSDDTPVPDDGWQEGDTYTLPDGTVLVYRGGQWVIRQ